MKKLTIVFLTLVLVLSLGLTTAFAANTYEYDLSTLEGAEGGGGGRYDMHPGAFDHKVILLMELDNYISLGELDLSKYDRVEFTYGADGGAQFVGEGVNTTFNFAKNKRDGVIASVNLIPVEGNWQSGQVTVSMDLSSVDYSGTIYLFLDIKGINSRTDGANISKMVFFEKEAAEETETEANAPTADLSIIGSMALVVAYSALVLKKKR